VIANDLGSFIRPAFETVSQWVSISLARGGGIGATPASGVEVLLATGAHLATLSSWERALPGRRVRRGADPESDFVSHALGGWQGLSRCWYLASVSQ